MAIRFEFSEGTSNKFWTIDLQGKSFTVWFGKIGTQGQAQTKSFNSENEAKAAYDKLIAEKTKKGYTRIGDTNIPASVAASATEKKEKDASEGGDESKTAPKKPSAVALIEKPTTDSCAHEVDDEVESVQSVTCSSGATAGQSLSSIARSNTPVRHSERRIRLQETDYLWASWHPRKQLPKPTPRRFDLDGLLRELESFKMQYGGHSTNWESKWLKANITPFFITRQEAEFWFEAVMHLYNDSDIKRWVSGETTQQQEERRKKQLIAKLGKFQFKTDRNVAAIQQRLGNGFLTYHWYFQNNPVSIPLLAYFQPKEILEFIHGACPTVMVFVLNHFRHLVLPYMNQSEIDELKGLCAKKMSTTELAPCLFAATLGMHDEVRSVIENIPDGGPVPWSMDVMAHLILSLKSPDEIEHQMRRLKIKVETAETARGILATTDTRLLDLICEASLQQFDERAADCHEVLMLAEAPETVRHILQVYVESKKLSAKSREWLERFPDWTVAELIKVASGKSKLSDAAKMLLQDFRRKMDSLGLDEDLAKALNDAGSSPEEQLPVMSDAELPDWMRGALEAMKAAKKSKLPVWADPRAVVPLVINGKRLAPNHMEAVLMALQQSTWENVHPFVRSLQANLERRVTEKLAWSLFQRWLREGAIPKDKWALMSVGFLGGDDCALKITPLVRTWPGESQHQRAVLGLECLRHIGSDTALMQINGIAQKLQFKGLKQRAMECMEEIANDKGLSREQLEDRIVPDCGLDEKGSRLFDFGPRNFSFILSPELKPLVKDDDGKVKSDLPKPGAKDDPEKAMRASEDWKVLKAQIKEVAKVQAGRLEHAMIVGRRWTMDEFDQLLVRHPLMINLVRRLVWAGYDESNKISLTFRVTEDQTYSDEHDRATDISAAKRVGIIHPAYLTDEQKAHWGEVMSDYEIVSPFEQLGRTVMGLEPGEIGLKEITRFKTKKLPAVTIVGALEKNGWQRGLAGDGGCFNEHVKQFYGANVTAVVTYYGIGMQYIMDSEDQAIETCFFLKGIVQPDCYRNSKDAMLLKDVDPVVVSEVLRVLTALTSKAQE